LLSGRADQTLFVGLLNEEMITKQDVMPALLGACPGFAPTWAEHLKWWGNEERGIFNDTAELATYVVLSYERGDTSEFTAVFDTVERILRDGDEEARGAASVGVLESVQVQASHYAFGPTVFLKWLGPLSHQAWSEIEALWDAGGGSLAGVVSLERQLREGVAPRRSWWPFRRSK
jgi:hypothetical protein